MRITLRKAHRLQEKITELINDRSNMPKETVDAMVHTNWYGETSALLAEHDRALKEKLALIDLRTDLRTMIGVENDLKGISKQMTEVKGLDSKINILSNIISDMDVQEKKEVVIRRIELKTEELGKSERAFGYSSSVNIPIFTDEYKKEAVELLQMLKKIKQQIEDKILESNVTCSLELSEEATALLVKVGLV